MSCGTVLPFGSPPLVRGEPCYFCMCKHCRVIGVPYVHKCRNLGRVIKVIVVVVT